MLFAGLQRVCACVCVVCVCCVCMCVCVRVRARARSCVCTDVCCVRARVHAGRHTRVYVLACVFSYVMRMHLCLHAQLECHSGLLRGCMLVHLRRGVHGHEPDPACVRAALPI